LHVGGRLDQRAFSVPRFGKVVQPARQIGHQHVRQFLAVRPGGLTLSFTIGFSQSFKQARAEKGASGLHRELSSVHSDLLPKFANEWSNRPQVRFGSFGPNFYPIYCGIRAFFANKPDR
jgi:hypothetical protein